MIETFKRYYPDCSPHHARTTSDPGAPTFRDLGSHAEHVAARLVEVICEDAESEAWLEESNQQLQGQITQLIQNGYRLRRERDAARAERLEALQKVATLDDQLAAARAEIAALHEWHPQSAVGALRMMRAEQVLADLRAKVAAEHDASFFGAPDGYETGWRQACRRVLALIEEADRADS